MRTPEIERFVNVPQEPDRYVYRIKSTENSSTKFGPCEICGKACSEVFYQVEGKTFDLDGQIAITYHECKNLFGHEACLIGARR